MGLYDEDYMPDQGEDEEEVKPKVRKGKGRLPGAKKTLDFSGKMRTYLIIALIALIVLVGFYAIYLYASPNFVKIDFKDNPLNLSEQSSTKIQVTISNNDSEPMKDLIISIKPYDNTSIVVIPSESQQLSVLGPSETRVLEYDLSTTGDILKGKYSIEVKVKNSKTEYVTYKTITISLE